MINKIKTMILILFCIITLLPVQIHAEDLQPDISISSDYAVVINSDTGTVIYNKNAGEKMYPASMTKIMTAILTIEYYNDLNRTVTITADMLAGLWEENASVAGFVEGDTPTVYDLLYGMALPSGADACQAAAYDISGSPEAFVNLMNQKAASLNLTGTHFANTTGLHDDNHYTTALDMAKLMKYCLENETFRTVFSASSYTTSPMLWYPEGITFSSSLFSTASSYGIELPGLTGGKTGFTFEAGHCLVSWGTVGQMNIIAVTAHGGSDYWDITNLEDTDTLYREFANWEEQVVCKMASPVASVTITHPYADSDEVTVYAPENISVFIPKDAEITLKCTLPSSIEAASQVQTLGGELQVIYQGNVLKSVPVSVTIPKERHLRDRIHNFFHNLFN